MTPRINLRKVKSVLAALSVLIIMLPTGLAAQDSTIPVPDFQGKALGTLKVENDGSVHSLFDEISLSTQIHLSPHTRVDATVDLADFMGYDAGWTFGPQGGIPASETGYARTDAGIETEILEQMGLDPVVSIILGLGYGAHRHVLTQDFTRYRYERSGTSGIDGFDLSVSLRLADRFTFTGALNPASFAPGSASRPDGYGGFLMVNDHGKPDPDKLINVTDSSLQIFYDSSANLSANRLYDAMAPGEAMTLAIGGTLGLNFAGIGIFGFGMTEYFLMYDRAESDILQAQWGAGFDIPLLAGMEANLSGSNAMVLSSTGSGSFINFGLDILLHITPVFGIFGAGAANGIIEGTTGSVEGGICLLFRHFELYAGYSDHAIGGDADRFAKGAFDKTEIRDGAALGGGFFLTFGASF